MVKERRSMGLQVSHSNDEWEAPQRLSSLSSSNKSNHVHEEMKILNFYVSKEMKSQETKKNLKEDKDEEENLNPPTYNDDDDDDEDLSEKEFSSRKPGHRFDDEDDDNDDNDDDDFDRDFYLSEEGQTFDDSNTDKFLGSSAKFKEREEMMAKSQMRGDALKSGNRGDTKIAGQSVSSHLFIYL